ncbi:ubiquitin-conjugating enzyme [Fusarium austroafricanum]|uniref:Ubiquitin-conjugating enzyme n=1 Tax=Fusarium austroafricanum TaxID=2364996 RepID=A0A8H4KIR3_9HYPO|nr:ubiquitin-conjugating enzyme [Fusarium austroafricanum]
MEVAGLVIGIVGLAGIFKTALEAWEFVDSARDQAESFKFLRTRLDNQRAIFLIWAERMGFGSPGGYNKSLDRPALRARQIANTLKQITILFSNTDELIQLYGLSIHSTEGHANGSPMTRSGDASIAIFRTRYNRVRAMVRSKRQLSILSERTQLQQSISLWRKMRWSIRDEKKTETLVTKIGALVADLEGLTRDIQAVKTREQYATEVVADISEAALHAIEDSSRAGENVISSAASIRLSSLRQAETLASASIASTSFFTAKSDGSKANGSEVDRHLNGIDAWVVDFSNIKQANLQVCERLAEMFPRYECYENSTRLYKETRRMAEEVKLDDWYTISPLNESYPDKFLGTFRGPEGTPYEGGIFHVRINAVKDYPFKPPRMWFLTKILHPNVDKHGAICMDIREEWSPQIRLVKLVVAVASLLDEPVWDNPIGGNMPLEWTTDRQLFDLRAREWTRRFATGNIINPGERDDGFYNVTESAT